MVIPAVFFQVTKRFGRILRILVGMHASHSVTLLSGSLTTKIGLPDNEIGLLDNGFGRNLSSDRPSAGQRADVDAFKIRIQPRFGLEA